MDVKKIVLAYSGGLDTSVILKWLEDEYGCEVVTFTADIGQGEEVEPARAKAEAMGVNEIYIEDLREEFVRDFVFPMFRANAVYEGEYLLGTSIARPLIAKRLEDIGCAAVMPLAAPIGSGLGIRNPYNILTIIENAEVPILVDAGVGTASDAAIAMELGCDGILMNTAIAAAQKPVLMASAMKKAVEAGREAFLAGRMPRKRFASASSPIDGTFF